MKKTLLTIALAVFALCGFAQSTTTYTDDLTVTINGESTEPQETNILVTENADGTYTLSLKNFMLGAGEDALGVGNIELSGITATEENGIKTFHVNQTINIAEGDAEGVETWLGPMLGDVPIVLSAKMTNEKLYCTIDIDMMSLLEQIIYVVFGTDEFNTTPEQGNTTTYTDDLTVTVNEESTEPQQTNILRKLLFFPL
ncbi:MAG: calycin-like domain-containing protein, partial [Paraprevotella sp.]|nr:calycin-like domain-containing protein [Paraprevotella sp.]